MNEAHEWLIKNRKKTYIVPGSKLDRLPKFIKSLVIFLKYFYHKYIKKITNPTYYPYHYDGVATKHNCSFMNDKTFIKSHARATKAADFGSDLFLRVHQAIWAAHTGIKSEGDLVELGTGRGFIMSAVLESIDNWNDLNRNAWLFDTFKSGWTDQDGNQDEKNKCDLYAESFNKTKENFSQWLNVNLVQGKLPQSLIEKNESNTSPIEKIDKICFLHIDLNYPEGEAESLDLLWSKIVKGGIVLLDDYATYGFERSYNLMDLQAKKLNRLILTTASGQGIIIK